jgi:putative membrane protein
MMSFSNLGQAIMQHRSLAILLFPLLAVAACAAPDQSGPGAAIAGDAGFVQTAFQDGMAEELSASYAATNAGSPAVKAFAAKMLADHDNMNVGLRNVATAQGMSVPTSPSDTQNTDIRAMSNESGAPFDKAYLAAEVARHKRLLQAYQTESVSGTNPALKTYAGDRMPVVQSHLSRAEALLSGV